MTPDPFPCSARELAAKRGVARATVYRSIAAGTLQVDAKASAKARRVVLAGGDLVWTVARWKAELAPHLAHIKPHLYGWTEDGDLHLLRGASVVVVPRGQSARDLERAVWRLAP